MQANPSQQVEQPRPTTATTNVVHQTDKPLCVRYAELLQLRQAVKDAQSQKSITKNRLGKR